MIIRNLKTKVILKNILLIVGIFICCYTSFSITNNVTGIYNKISLRYNEPFTETKVQQVLDEDENTNPTFWTVDESLSVFEKQSVPTTNIVYLGTPSNVYNVDFTQGSYPVGTDIYGCAISESLAWKLWGSYDVISQEFSYNNSSYYVRGVFKDKSDIMLSNAFEDTEFTAIEINNIPLEDPFVTANKFILANNLDKPSNIISGSFVIAISSFIGWLPLLAICPLLLIFLGEFKKTLNPFIWQSSLFIIAICIILLLPSMLSKIPNYLLPSAWSDFEFWSVLFKTYYDRLIDWFSIESILKDISVKIYLIQQIAILFIQIVLIFLLSKNSKAYTNTEE